MTTLYKMSALEKTALWLRQELNRFFSGVMRPSFHADWMQTAWELVFPVKP